MYIQCFVQKHDGSDVFVDFEGVRYIFSKNQLGDAVCFVGNQAHQRRLLASGAESYLEYIPPETDDPSFNPGATALPLGGAQNLNKPAPPAEDPLPDALTVDESLTTVDEGAGAPPHIPPEAVTTIEDLPPDEKAVAEASKAAATAEPIEVEWAQEAVDTKIKEFKFLDADNFKSFVDTNAGRIMGWPLAVRAEIAKKLHKKFPDLDPGIEGFVINDYLGGGNTGDS